MSGRAIGLANSIYMGREIDNCAIDLEREKSLFFLFVSERRSSRHLVAYSALIVVLLSLASSSQSNEVDDAFRSKVTSQHDEHESGAHYEARHVREYELANGVAAKPARCRRR